MYLFLALALAPFVSAEIQLNVETRGGQSALTEEIRKATPGIFESLYEKTGLRFEGPLQVTLCLTQGAFDNYVAQFRGRSLVDALGIYASPIPGDVPRVALNMGRINEVQQPPETTYKHELLHALFDQNIAPELRPLWFEEGMAQWVSELPYTAIMTQFGYASGTGEDPNSLTDISQMMRAEGVAADGYAHGLAAVQRIIRIHGEDGVKRLLVRMSEFPIDTQSASFSMVYGQVFGASYAEFEREFIGLRTRSIWQRLFGFVGSYMFSVSMAVAGVLLILAYWRKKRTEERLVAKWSEQDELFPPDPEWSFGQDPDSLAADSAMKDHDELYGDGNEWKRGYTRDDS